MASVTKIEWAGMSWNPVTGCTKISPGCANCYANSMAVRLHAMAQQGYRNGYDNGFGVTLQPGRLEEPLQRKKPTTYFVCSMSDLFHDDVPDEFIDRVFGVIRRAPQHNFLVLTKRAARMAAYFATRDVPANAWIGVSVDDRRHGLPRLDFLRQVPAQVRFASFEPLLEDLGQVDLSGIDLVIAGGESGPGARPMAAAWVMNVKRCCDEQGAIFYFKQWGQYGEDGVKRNKKVNGRLFLGRVWDDLPQTGARVAVS